MLFNSLNFYFLSYKKSSIHTYFDHLLAKKYIQKKKKRENKTNEKVVVLRDLSLKRLKSLKRQVSSGKGIISILIKFI